MHYCTAGDIGYQRDRGGVVHGRVIAHCKFGGDGVGGLPVPAAWVQQLTESGSRCGDLGAVGVAIASVAAAGAAVAASYQGLVASPYPEHSAAASTRCWIALWVRCRNYLLGAEERQKGARGFSSWGASKDKPA